MSMPHIVSVAVDHVSLGTALHRTDPPPSVHMSMPHTDIHDVHMSMPHTDIHDNYGWHTLLVTPKAAAADRC